MEALIEQDYISAGVLKQQWEFEEEMQVPVFPFQAVEIYPNPDG